MIGDLAVRKFPTNYTAWMYTMAAEICNQIGVPITSSAKIAQRFCHEWNLPEPTWRDLHQQDLDRKDKGLPPTKG